MQCRRWQGRSRLEHGRERCVLEISHEGPCEFVRLPEHPVVSDTRCLTHKRKVVHGMELVWRCVEDLEHDGRHVYRVAPDEERV